MKKTCLPAIALLGLLARPVMAQDEALNVLEAVGACAADVLKVCDGVLPGEGRIKACILDKTSQLSSGCQTALGDAFSKSLPDDGKDAKMMRFDHLNAYRYCEVFLIGGNPVTRDLSAGVYNTTGRNNEASARDSCPDSMWAKVDPAALKAQYNVLGVFKNGPRFWLYDWIDLPVGTQRGFDGVQARWFAHVQLPKAFGHTGATFYKPTTVERKSRQGYAKGQTVFILDDPTGTPWLMQAASLIVDPRLTYDDLKALDKKLKLAPGWKYRTKVLDKDLEIHAINGVARIVQDDLENTYNACFTEGNQTACSYQP